MDKEKLKGIFKKSFTEILDFDKTGKEYSISNEDVKVVKDKFISLCRKEGISDDEIPKYLFKEERGGKIMADKVVTDEKRLKELEDTVKTFQEESKKEKIALAESHKADLEAVRKELEETYKSQAEEVQKKLDVKNSVLEKKLEETQKELSDNAIELHEEKTEKRAKNLLESGVWPGVVEIAKKIMLFDTDSTFGTIKLSDEEKAPEFSISEAIEKMLSEIPKEARVSYIEKTTKRGSQETKKFMDVDEVNEYAKEKKMSYEEACSKLSGEGKIEHIMLQ
jgi:hypothetical protein